MLATAAATVTLTGCTPSAEARAIDKAREQFAGLEEYFASNAPPAGTDFVAYVYDQQLGWGTLAMDAQGRPDPAVVGVGGGSETQLYSATDEGGIGTVGVIVTGYAESGGYGPETKLVYSCFTASFDMGSDTPPRYADTDCIPELSSGIAGDTHVSIGQLGG